MGCGVRGWRRTQAGRGATVYTWPRLACSTLLYLGYRWFQLGPRSAVHLASWLSTILLGSTSAGLIGFAALSLSN